MESIGILVKGRKDWAVVEHECVFGTESLLGTELDFVLDRSGF